MVYALYKEDYIRINDYDEKYQRWVVKMFLYIYGIHLILPRKKEIFKSKINFDYGYNKSIDLDEVVVKNLK